jgi:iron complex transport system permease protein
MLKRYLIAFFLLLAALVLSVAVGSVFISPAALLQVIAARLGGLAVPTGMEGFDTILFSLRLPHTLLIAMAGAALAGSGAAYQGLFRNPLADPYLIGVASGAGLGAVAAMTISVVYTPLGLLVVPLAAFAGALLAVFIVYQMAKVGRTVPTTNLILAGVAFGAFATALTSYLMINAVGDLRRALVWLLGGSSLSGWQPVVAALPYIVLGLGALLTVGHALNVLQFGDEQAQQMGVHVARVRWVVVFAASLATAAAISFAGVIGFVGLIVPHLIRLVWGGNYRHLLPLSIIGGAVLLLLADVLARTLMSPQELPVGIVTALLGAPFFLFILRRARQQNYW